VKPLYVELVTIIIRPTLNKSWFALTKNVIDYQIKTTNVGLTLKLLQKLISSKNDQMEFK